MAEVNIFSYEEGVPAKETPDPLSKKTEDFNKPYEPSPIGGIAAIGGATAAGIAASKLPWAKYISNIKKLKTPVLQDTASVAQETRITEPLVVDKVDEILTVVPTKMERTEETINSASAQMQKYLETIDKVKTESAKAPLTMGDKDRRFGSALYDYVAQFPAKKPLPADEWIKVFSDFNRLSNYKSPNAALDKVRMSITKEELFDTNIANFDKAGNLIGGFLKTAKDQGLQVSKTDLLEMVKKSPGANLKVRRFKWQGDLDKEALDLAQQIDDSVVKNIKTLRDQATAAGNTPAANQYNSLASQLQDERIGLFRNKAAASEILRGYESARSDGIGVLFKPNINALKTIKQLGDRANITLDFPIDELVSKNSAITRKIGSQLTQDLFPRYGGQKSYRIGSAEEYIEDVAYYPGDMPFGKNVTPGSSYSRHFERVQNIPFNNQLYHARYGKRSLEGAPNQKVYAIDELQSDVQQAAFGNDKAREKVRNPFNQEQEFASANFTLQKLKDKMDAIAKKGAQMSEKERFEFYKTAQEFDELRKKTINLSTLSQMSKRSSDDVPFMPFFDRSSWGDHALKNVLKSAAENNIQWVAINPVERLHALKRDAKLGDFEFYGTATGKAGIPGFKIRSNGKDVQTNTKATAVIPERMKKLAEQYNSEAKTIRISKSDPNKPFKVIEDFNRGSAGRVEKLKLSDPTEHIAAFKTEEEAIAYNSYLNESAKVVKMEANDPRNYYEAFAIKVTPEMKGTPFKLYKKEGGLVVNIFA
jgi:hypothetical protein